MSEVRIRRGGTGRLSAKPAALGAGKGRAASRGKGNTSQVNALLAKLPVSHETLQRAMTAAVAVVGIGAVAGVATFFGLPGAARIELAELAARGGYEVEKVEVTGISRMDAADVYSIALGEVDRSMVNVDLERLRQDIMRLPWVKDARVSRRLPDTLAVDIVERQPTAVWQHQGQLVLIDASGAELEPVSVEALPDLPLVVGEDANRQAERRERLMEAAPALKPVLASATWVGNRRWDLRFQSGEILSLPEGDEAAAAALVNFARLDGINRLLGRGILRFDMRDPGKFVLRMAKGRAAPQIDTKPGEGEGGAIVAPTPAPEPAVAHGEEGEQG